MTEMKEKEVRVRMAPSPTGFMHVGTLRTVLYDELFARKTNGKLILRIEDTDQSRKVEGTVENLLDMLAWAGIAHDEGPFMKNGEVEERGDYGPYTQSLRLDIYREHAQELVDEQHAYQCFCTSERLTEMRTMQQKMKQPPMYDRTCTKLAPEEIQQRITDGEKYVLRMKVPRGEEVIVEDLVRGRVIFQSDTVDDQVIMKSDGFPTYHLAVVVDDHLMQISHVIRGEEWLPSTPKHILLYKMFGWNLPQFAHLPLLLNKDKSKLSKRQGDVSVEDYKTKGYLPEALLNFVAFLGWHPGKGEEREIFTHDDLVDAFDFAQVHKAGAVFDIDKLNKVNAHYIKKHPIDELHVAAQPFFVEKEYYKNLAEDTRDEYMQRVLTVEQERLVTLATVGDENLFFFRDVSVDKDILRWKDSADTETQNSLALAMSVLEKIEEISWTQAELERILMKAAGDKRGDLLYPLRAALTGEKRSPSPIDCAWVLGKSETLTRIRQAQNIF